MIFLPCQEDESIWNMVQDNNHYKHYHYHINAFKIFHNIFHDLPTILFAYEGINLLLLTKELPRIKKNINFTI